MFIKSGETDSILYSRSNNVTVIDHKMSILDPDSTIKNLKILNVNAPQFAELYNQEEIVKLIREYLVRQWWQFWKDRGNRELLWSKIEKRDSLYYGINEKLPYSGKTFENHPNGQRSWETTIRNGKFYGDEILFDTTEKVSLLF